MSPAQLKRSDWGRGPASIRSWPNISPACPCLPYLGPIYIGLRSCACRGNGQKGGGKRKLQQCLLAHALYVILCFASVHKLQPRLHLSQFIYVTDRNCIWNRHEVLETDLWVSKRQSQQTITDQTFLAKISPRRNAAVFIVVNVS